MKVKVSRRWLIYLAAAGPGLIAAAAGNDAGGIVTYSSAGAQFVYRSGDHAHMATTSHIRVDPIPGTPKEKLMSRVRVHNFSVSLDGFGTGEGQSADADGDQRDPARLPHSQHHCS